MEGGSGGGDSEPLNDRPYGINLVTQTQRVSSLRIGYLLVVLAVVLVPVVPHNQSHGSAY